jgi:regulator of protease activity HflC (stomatin/prohibitin superfamily)
MPFADSARLVTWRLAETSYNARNQQTVTVSQTKMTRVDLRESVMDFPSQPIITRDNVEIQVHPMVLYRIMDPVRAAYETFDLAHAIEKLVQTTLRSIIGDMGLDDTLASREEIERMLQHKIRNVAQNWGLKIMAVELLEIIPTPSIQEAMHKQLAAERIRRAAIVQSDGIREKTRTEAEGDCQSIIAVATGEQQVEVLRAKGLADSRVLIAKAEADAVGIIAESLKEFGVNPTAYLIALRYVETFLAVSTQASKRVVYFPYETDVAGSLREVRA